MKMKKIRNPQIWWRKRDELVREIAKAKRQRKKQSDLQREAVHVLAAVSSTGRTGMDDIVNYKMTGDYKVYELRNVGQGLDRSAQREPSSPIGRIYIKSAEVLKDLLNNMPPWEA